MTKRKFFSIKFQKYILPDDKNFWNIARDEVVYRLDENLSRFAGQKDELSLLRTYGGEGEAGEVLEAFQDKKLKKPEIIRLYYNSKLSLLPT
jgi:hypothetical protein